MEAYVDAGLSFFFPGKCYKTVVEDHNFTDDFCSKMMFSRFLSLTVILGAVIVKVPQISKIMLARSVEGLSYLSNILELLAVTFTCVYNLAKGFNFSSWGESFFILLQVLVILLLMFHFNGQMYLLFLSGPVFGVLCWYLTSSHAPMWLLSMLQTSVIFLMLSSRLTQVYTTFVNKSTGQLSLITYFMNWAGTMSRIFTTMQETQDPIILATFLTSFAVNSIILIQFVVYWNSGARKAKKTD